MELHEIGVFIRPDGSRVDVYGETRTHEEYAQSIGSTVKALIKAGHIRVSSGTTFQFQRMGEREKAEIRKFLREHAALYEGQTLTLMDGRGQEWEISAETVLNEAFEL